MRLSRTVDCGPVGAEIERHDIDMYAEGHKVQLPLNMLDALRAYDKDKELKAAMGEEFSAAFLKIQEWNDPRTSARGNAKTRYLSLSGL